MHGPRTSLDSYRPPVAGQLINKVVSRHCLPSSLGAWELGSNRQAGCHSCTRQELKKHEEQVPSPKTGKLERSELQGLQVDIAALQETRLADSRYDQGEGIHFLLAWEECARA